MPTYVYGCADCGAQFEQFQRFSDAPLTTCPRCQGSIKRIFQPVGIVFKGSGWYITDSRNTKTSTTPAATPAASDTTTPASEPKAESTPKADKPAEAAPAPAPTPPAVS